MVLRHLTGFLALCCALLFGATSASAASPSVSLRADSLDSGEVILRIQSSSAKTLRRPQLKVFRGRENGKLNPYADISSSNAAQVVFYDAPIREGFYSYQARIVGRARKGPKKGRKIVARSRVTAVYVELPAGNPGDSNDPGSDDTSDGVPPPVQLGEGISRCPASFAQDVLDLVNGHRAAFGVSPLQLDEHLNWAAEKHSNWMIVKEELTHDGFSHDGWYEEIVESGFQGTSFGQNIAALAFHSPASVVAAWMKSEGHRENILKSSFGHMGLSCLADKDGSFWWTQDFGS